MPVGTLSPEQKAALNSMLDQIESNTASGEIGASVEGAMAEQANSPSMTNLPDPRRIPQFQAQPSGRSIEEYSRINAIPGRELDATGGGDWLTRLTMGFIRSKSDQGAYLEDKFQGRVRLDDEGQWIVGNEGPDGSIKEITLDEKKMSGKDVIDLLGSAPEFVMAMAAGGWAAKALPLAKGAAKSIMGQSAAGALGWSGVGAIKDIVQRMAQGRDIDPMEIAHVRGSEAAIDAVLGGGFGGVAHAITKIPKHLAGIVPSATEISALAGKGAENIANTMPVELIRTPAERLGSSVAASGEGFISRMPFAKGIFENLHRRKNEAEIRFAKALLGEDPGVAAGQRLQAAITGGAEAAEGAVAGARRDVVRGASEDIQSVFKQPSGPGRSALDVGSFSEAGAKTRFADSRGIINKDYDKVYSHPESQEDVFPLSGMAAEAKKLLDKLPSVPRLAGEAVDEGVVVKGPWKGVAGEAADVEAASARELIGEAADKEALAILKPLSERGEQSTRLFDLVQFRTRLQDAINKKEDPLKVLGTHNLKALSASITRTIDEVTEALPNTQFRKDLIAANSNFKTHIEKFGNKHIEPLLIESTERGSIDPEKWVGSVFSSADKWQEMNKFFGKGSPEIQQLKDYFVSDVLGSAKNSITGTLDGAKLINAVDRMPPEIADDIFGSAANVKNIKASAREMLAADGKINFDEFAEAMRTEGGIDSGRIKSLMQAEEARSSAYRNEIVKALREGGPIEIEPTEFVERYLNGKVSVGDIADVMRMIERTGDTELLQSVRYHYLFDLFKKSASKTTTPEDFVMALKGNIIKDIDPGQFIKNLAEPRTRKILNEVMDPFRAERINDFAYYAAGAQKVKEARGMIGSLAPGMVISDLILKGQMLDMARYGILAAFLTSPRLASIMDFGAKKTSAIRLELSPEKAKDLIRYVTVSPEFARFMGETTDDPDELQAVAESIRDGTLGDDQPQ